MITRLIAKTLTPIISKSRFLKLPGARGVISNRPYWDYQAPSRHGCHTTLVVKQGIHGFPLYRRAHMGYLHVDFKAKTRKQALQNIKTLLQLRCVGQFTTWGYGELQWISHHSYVPVAADRLRRSKFRILKGLPPSLSLRERQLVMAALLHDLVDTDLHPSKLGRSLSIPDSYVRWLCAHHHAFKAFPHNSDLRLLQEADVRTSRYARLLPLPTRRRQLIPTNTKDLAHQLEQAAQCSIYRLYSVIYHSHELRNLIASKTRSTETLRNHLIGVANWTLFLLRSQSFPSSSASAALVGEPGATPGPVEMEDPQDRDEPLASW